MTFNVRVSVSTIMRGIVNSLTGQPARLPLKDRTKVFNNPSSLSKAIEEGLAYRRDLMESLGDSVQITTFINPVGYGLIVPDSDFSALKTAYPQFYFQRVKGGGIMVSDEPFKEPVAGASIGS